MNLKKWDHYLKREKKFASDLNSIKDELTKFN